ncbi:MAG: hypothetical protein K6A77_04435 [Clostridiales bacterium]|nr:hypothetical protein [Clostridiales bacterium]
MKKRWITVLAMIMACVLLAACSKGGGEKKQDNAGGDASATVAESTVTEESADEGASEEASEGIIVEDFEFSKTASDEELEKPITACGLQFDDNEDL